MIACLFAVMMFLLSVDFAVASATYSIDPYAAKFFDSLGYHRAYVISRIVDFESKNGTKVLTRNTDFQRMFRSYLGYERQWDNVFARFDLPSALVALK